MTNLTNADIVHKFNTELAAFREFHYGGTDGKQPHKSGSTQQEAHGGGKSGSKSKYPDKPNQIKNNDGSTKTVGDVLGLNDLNDKKPVKASKNKQMFFDALKNGKTVEVINKETNKKLQVRFTKTGLQTSEQVGINDKFGSSKFTNVYLFGTDDKESVFENNIPYLEKSISNPNIYIRVSK